MTLDQVRALLRQECEKAGGQKKWADAHGVSAAYVSDVIQGRKEPGVSLLDGLGLERRMIYVKKTAEAANEEANERRQHKPHPGGAGAAGGAGGADRHSR